MFTNVKIPIEPAPKDPKWIIKKHAGKKLDPIELEEYFHYKHDQDKKYLTSGKHGYIGIPSSSTISQVIY